MEKTKTLDDTIQDQSMEGVNLPKVVAVTSGKGGVGKTNVVANLAVSLSSIGKTVLVLDADLGLGNIDVLFGIIPKYTLDHVILGEKELKDVIVSGPCGIQILPTSSGTEDLTHLSSEQKLVLLGEIDRLENPVDIFLIDTGAGISSNVLYFNTVAQEIIVVASPEPTSVTDAYAIMKVLSTHHGEKRFRLLVNMVEDEREAKEVFHKLTLVADKFLDIAIEYLSYIPRDDYLRKAVCQQRAVVDLYPTSRSSLQFIKIAKKIIQWPVQGIPKGNVQFMWKKLLMPDSGE